MFALDTNTLIHFFKGAGRVKDNLLTVPPSEVAIPSVALFEIEIGILQSRQPSERRAVGIPLRPIEDLIAAKALAHAATLVTHNVREFQRVRGLNVVDWY